MDDAALSIDPSVARQPHAIADGLPLGGSHLVEGMGLDFVDLLGCRGLDGLAQSSRGSAGRSCVTGLASPWRPRRQLTSSDTSRS